MTEHPDSLIERGLTDDEAVAVARSGRTAGEAAPWGQVVKVVMTQRQLHLRTATLERLVRRVRRYAISALLALLGATGTGAKFALNHAAERATAEVREQALRDEVDALRADLKALQQAWRQRP